MKRTAPKHIKAISLLAVLVTASLTMTACSQLKNFSANTANDSIEYENTPLTETNAPSFGSIQANRSSSPLSLDPNCLTSEDAYAAYQGPAYGDLWRRIRSGFAIPYTDNKRIETHRKWYAKQKTYMPRVTERANRYMYGIVEKLEAKGLPLELALLPIVESAFDPFAYSHGRASGMWQFIPGTAKRFKLERNYWYDGRRDIEASTDAAIKYLTYLHKFFDGDWLLALAAYNTGEGNVRKAVRRNKKAGKPTDFWSLKLPRETRAYVPQLLALSQIVQDPNHHNVKLNPILDKPFYKAVNVDSQIDLAKAAELAEIEIKDLSYLNPGFNQWATDPNGPHQLLVPVEVADKFERNLKQYPPDQRMVWENYTVQSGDVLSKIARKFNTSVDTIRKVNKLKNNTIRVKQNLLIPKATKSSQYYAFSDNQRTKQKQDRSGTANSTKNIYHVKSGDSFWKIARSYKVNASKLAKWNGMSPKDPLKIGKELVVWTENTKVASSQNSQASSNSSNPLLRKVAYQVRSGDSLHRIADRFNLAVNDIVNWNTLRKSKYIQPGQKLTLWVNVANAH
ncbi:MAG: LysM peptidoglycan-binding domain-containing protein [Cellvibrionaceae bacterium]